MYTGKADISTALVVGMVYAAVKYDIKLLLDACIEYIQKNAKDVLQSEEILSAPQPVLRLVIKRGCTKEFVDAYDCYIVAKKWALCQIKRKNEEKEIGEGRDVDALKDRLSQQRNLGKDVGAESKEEHVFVEGNECGVKQNVLEEEVMPKTREEGHVDKNQVLETEDKKEEEEEEEEEDREEEKEEEISSPDEIRKVLGDVLDVIRFRDMPLQFFIKRVSTENILPESRKSSIMIDINSKYILNALVCHATSTYMLGDDFYSDSREDELSFTVSTYVQLTHVSVFSTTNIREDINGQLKIFSEKNNLLIEQNISSLCNNHYLDDYAKTVLLQKSVSMVPNVIYTVCTSISIPLGFPSTYMIQGVSPINSYSNGGFTIKFVKSRQDPKPSRKDTSLIRCLTFDF